MANKGMQGIVIGESGDRVKIRVFRNNTCENCDCVLQDACDADSPSPRRGMFDLFADRSALELEATNAAAARIGDRIVVKIKSDRSLVKGSFLVYLLPGMLFLAGLFAAGWLARVRGLAGDGEILAQLAGGLLMLVFSYGLAKALMWRKGTAEYVPEVTHVLQRAEPEASAPSG